MKAIFSLGLILVILSIAGVNGQEIPISMDTEMCISCHETATPGIVGDWKAGRHSSTTISMALSKNENERRISIGKLPTGVEDVVIGCAECHTMNPDKHADTFEHNGYQVHVIVTPSDCATCHPRENEEYKSNIMRDAYANLMNNPVYRDLMLSINSVKSSKSGVFSETGFQQIMDADSCLFCHGTDVQVKGTHIRQTSMGEMSFPVLSGWPNQGVGRLNPDKSLGSCSSCHPRHRFSIEMARKPDACKECHTGPDVPAGKVYEVSKHGNIFKSHEKEWNFSNVPWVVGEDFQAPTCSACHMSGVVSPDGETIVERTHTVNDRLPWRIFGLIYAHPHPIKSDTTIIRNSLDLPLPTDFDGKFADSYLIDSEEQRARYEKMQSICLSCHSKGWVEGHFEKYLKTIQMTNEVTRESTDVLIDAWTKGLAKGLDANDSPFNESIEKMWIEQWLFYANSTRFASAMGGADYGAFANGRWYMMKNLEDMKTMVKLLSEKDND